MISPPRFALPRSVTRWAVLEAAVFPTVALALAYALNPRLAIGPQVIPWLWLAPLLVALRYGLGPGLESAAVLILGSFLIRDVAPKIEPWPILPMLAGLLTTLFAGQYGSWWIDRLRRSELRSEYFGERIEAITRAFYVTRISHDLLEQSLITRPTSLRTVFVFLRKLLNEHEGRLDNRSAQALLQVLANYCRIEAASLYGVRHSEIDPQPLASIGPDHTLDLSDPLVHQSLEDSAAAYYGVDELLIKNNESRYRLSAPLHASDGTLLGLLAVSDMPLLALEEENLLALAAIIEYYADEAWARRRANDLLRQIPDCPPNFACEIIKLTRLRVAVGLRSTLLRLRVPIDRAEDIFKYINDTRRGLDLYWRLSDSQDYGWLILLLPLSTRTATDGYLSRLDTLFEKRLGAGLQALGCRFEHGELNGDDPMSIIQALLNSEWVNVPHAG